MNMTLSPETLTQMTDVKNLQTDHYTQEYAKHVIPWEQIDTRIAEDKRTQVDFEAQVRDIHMDDTTGELVINGENYHTGDRINRVFARFVPKGTQFLMTVPVDLQAYNVNYFLRNMLSQDRTVLVRARTRDDGSKLIRTVLSDKYGIMDNDLMVQVLKEKAGDFQPVTFYLDEDYMHMRLVTPRCMDMSFSVGDFVHAGAHGVNSETGCSSAKLIALAFTLACKNGAISPVDLGREIKIHRGKDLETARKNMEAFIETQSGKILDKAMEFLTLIRDAQKDIYAVDNTDALAKYLGRKLDWSIEFTDAVAARMYREATNKYGVMQAMTFVAQSLGWERRLEVEKQAGELLKGNLRRLSALAAEEAQLIRTGGRFYFLEA